jgi:hypothetical protein
MTPPEAQGPRNSPASWAVSPGGRGPPGDWRTAGGAMSSSSTSRHHDQLESTRAGGRPCAGKRLEIGRLAGHLRLPVGRTTTGWPRRDRSARGRLAHLGSLSDRGHQALVRLADRQLDRTSSSSPRTAVRIAQPPDFRVELAARLKPAGDQLCGADCATHHLWGRGLDALLRASRARILGDERTPGLGVLSRSAGSSRTAGGRPRAGCQNHLVIRSPWGGRPPPPLPAPAAAEVAARRRRS